MNWYWIIFYLSLTVAVPVVVGLWRYRNLDKATRFFLYLLMAMLITELGSHFYRIYFGNNMIVLNAYTFVSAILLGHYVYNVSGDKRMLYAFYFVGMLLVIESLLFPGELSSYSISALSLATIGALLMVSFQMVDIKITERSLIINGGLIFYFMSNFLYFFTARYLQSTGEMDYLVSMVIVKSFTNMICYTWYSFGIWTAFT
jgi:hypothetical protein